MEPTTVQTELTNRMLFHTCDKEGDNDISLNSGSMDVSTQTAKTPSCAQEDLITLLKCLQDKGIRATMAEQITTLQKTFTMKMETLQTHRMLVVVNSQMNLMDRVYEPLKQENMKLESQVQELT